jgi:hypothetical protein
MTKKPVASSAPSLSGEPLAGTRLPQTGGSFTRQTDGSLKPAEDGSKPEQDPPATSAKTGKD